MKEVGKRFPFGEGKGAIQVIDECGRGVAIGLGLGDANKTRTTSLNDGYIPFPIVSGDFPP